jgi:hypothetical protein
MTLPIRLLPAAAALAALAALAAPARAAEPGFEPRTVGDLADVCTGGPGGAERAAAENFCDGFAQGVLQLMRAHEKTAICLPDHPPTRRQTMAEFVTWSKAKEDRAGAPASRGLEAFFKQRFPCNK